MKKTLKAVLFVIFLSCTSRPTFAQESPLSTGNTIYPHCTAENVQQKIMCSAYVIGFTSGIINQAILTKTEPLFCLPHEGNNAQTIAVFVKYMSDHPEKRHFDTPSLIIMSLSEAFPCKK